MSKQLQADLMLLGITIVWGASYMLTKIGLEGLEPLNLTALRFIIAFVISGAIFYKKILESNKKTIKYAFILGILLFGMFISMAFGLGYTTASNAGFLISLSVILIPIISFFFLKRKIERKVIIGVILAFIGIALLSLDAELKMNFGDMLCIFCALLCSVHVIIIEIFTKEVDPVSLGVLQLGFAGIFSLVSSLLLENFGLPKTGLSWISVLLLSVFCTAIGYVVQTMAQQHTTATHTGLILSLEPVFSAAFAFVFLKEILPPRGYLGAFILLTGVIIAEIDFKKISKKDEIEDVSL
ncbi:MAG: DMT family transporter [Clostridiales bacterium]|nr:DMT family transporter [Clostridiales bacterium]